MRKLLGLALCALAACATPPQLEEGRWTGTLTPMNHPDMANPIAYDVRYVGNDLAVDLIGPDGATVPTRDIRLEADTLYFAFNESEANVPLQCALGRDETSGFSGRCADASGKWARFTMRSPG